MRPLTGTNTLGQSGPGSNSNEEVLHISQSSKTEVSQSDSLVSYQKNTHWGKSYVFEEMQSAYSTTTANWFAKRIIRIKNIYTYTYIHMYLLYWNIF